jgi:hypothetical protein
MNPRDFSDLLGRLDTLPDTALVPIPIVAKHDNVSESTVKRNYPLVRISERICGVPMGFLRHRGEAPKPAV